MKQIHEEKLVAFHIATQYCIPQSRIFADAATSQHIYIYNIYIYIYMYICNDSQYD